MKNCGTKVTHHEKTGLAYEHTKVELFYFSCDCQALVNSDVYTKKQHMCLIIILTCLVMISMYLITILTVAVLASS